MLAETGMLAEGECLPASVGGQRHMWRCRKGRMRPFPGAAHVRPHGRCMHRPTSRRARRLEQPEPPAAPTRYSSRAVTLPAPTYDLVLLLDAEADEQAHTRILGEAREAIKAEGELLRDDTWGDRALTYPIDHKTTARYHLLQFHATTPGLLERLDRSLRFADEVVRFRVIKLKPGTPAAPDMGTPSTPARVAEPTPAPAVEAAPESEAGPEPEATVEPETAPEPEAVQEPEAAPALDPEAAPTPASAATPEPDATQEPEAAPTPDPAP